MNLALHLGIADLKPPGLTRQAHSLTAALLVGAKMEGLDSIVRMMDDDYKNRHLTVVSRPRQTRVAYCRPTRSKIIRARFTLSETMAVRRGEGRLMSGSRARRTAAMIAAAMTSVDFIRVCSCICSAQASRSRAIARFISPIRAPLIAPVWGQVCMRDCLGKPRMEGSFSSLRRADTALQSKNPASCL